MKNKPIGFALILLGILLFVGSFWTKEKKYHFIQFILSMALLAGGWYLL
ncbi:MAG: hypothetical protein J7L39_02095 [Candidatus Aenigmarchaeota archaeon]|nr:hypothetical protein [Candidatus Aenigmarchaeota archaeon]